MKNILTSVLYGGSLTLLFGVIMVISKIINDWLTPYKVDDQLTQKDNFALALSMGGYLGGTAIIFVGGVIGPSKGLIADLMSVGGYSFLGIVLLNLSRFINDKLILYKFSNTKEIIEDKNTGTGAVQFGSYIASALIIAGAISGEGGGVLTALAFYALGQVVLILGGWFYNLITPYDIHKEIEEDNVAVGVSFAGALVAIAVVLMGAVAGNFISWTKDLLSFGLNALIIFILLPVVRLFFDKIIIPSADLNKEIKNDRNTGAALLEGVTMISVAIVLVMVLG